MEFRRVSEAVIRRMPKYYRQLQVLQAQGMERISSGKLAQMMRLNASQVRQDFNCFGGFGQQGYGYNVTTLLNEIKNILALNQTHSAIVAGAGNIGRALASFDYFEQQGFTITALFDINEELVGTEVNGKPVLHIDSMEEYVRENNVEVGIITARRSAAQELADRMVKAGVKGIWNFAPADVTAAVPVENIHMTDSLICLTYKMFHNVTEDEE
ncbi:MAG: redox-sensing transcriptional repressor Rex [Clostridia bacterium]|nr:redox-sensing transcriptional repressor Rex [Clostridia bacterium]MBQ4610631.1 redox-sensing transcriptional repressor Rex [Clostridia bacterium]